ncbi:MAG: EpsI family protein [Burkholderiaceae bacterium]|nr:EpsI family protein [Burkholderiaceae bacterium]
MIRNRWLGALVLASMVGAASVAAVMKPSIYLADEFVKLDLEQVFPESFGTWKLDRSVGLIVNPQVQATLDKLYNQTLSRTYINPQGYRIMLSIAYGLDQRDAMQVHYPEVCYPAQGFTVDSNDADLLKTPMGEIPVRRLKTILGGQRYEPVTYWTTVGERVVANSSTKKFAEMAYGLKGRIPDGLLFRVSSIDRNSPAAFAAQDLFVADILAAADKRQLARLSGLGRTQHLAAKGKPGSN